MSGRQRLLLFALAIIGLLPAVWRVSAYMPTFGAHPMPYGEAINASAPRERHVTNMVTAVNFDYRAIDTLGEEFMLLCAVTGTVVLLRGNRGEALTSRSGRVPDHARVRRAEAITLTGRLFAPLILVFGIYVVLHATVTPGGGFQGGAILASGALLFWLCETYETWRRLLPSRMAAISEGAGALVFALAGFGSMLTGHAFLQNVLPLGHARDMLSGGLMLIVNAGVAFAVAGGFANLFLEFLEETRAVEQDKDGAQ